MIFPWLILAGSQLMDAVSTLIATSRGQAEMNPLGVKGAVLEKVLVTFSFPFLWNIWPGEKKRAWRIALMAGVSLIFVVVVKESWMAVQ